MVDDPKTPETKEPEQPEPEATGDPEHEAVGAADPSANGNDVADADAPPELDYDPELVGLPRKRRRHRHPLVALVVIGLSLYVLWFLRHDFLFFFQPRQPVKVTDVPTALKQGSLRHNTHVTLVGAPDRKHALILEARSGGYDSFFRLVQGQNRVFVQRHRELRNTDQEISTSHTGQLVRFTSLPYEDNLRQYFQKSMTVANDLTFTELKRGRSAGDRAMVTSVKGERVRLGPDSMLWINVAYPNEWVVQLRKAAYPKEEAAKAQLAEVNLPHLRDTEKSNIHWRFVVHAEPDQVPLLVARFKDRKHAEVVRRQLSYSARWNQIKVAGRTLEINAADPTFPTRFEKEGDALKPVKQHPVKIEDRSVLYITTSSKFTVGDDAMVLLSGAEPGDKWYVVPLYLVLFGFIILNLVSLVLRLRGKSA